jgi:hypothetical protein
MFGGYEKGRIAGYGMSTFGGIDLWHERMITAKRSLRRDGLEHFSSGIED